MREYLKSTVRHLLGASSGALLVVGLSPETVRVVLDVNTEVVVAVVLYVVPQAISYLRQHSRSI